LNFSAIDLVVVIAYLLFVTVVGLYFSDTKNSKDFFLADKNLPWYFIMLSIVATETSSLTFLNVPGISFKTDFSFLQIALGFIFGRVIVAFYILPSYYKNNYVSVYQWIGENLGVNTQKYTSSIFLITRVLADGVRLYATSIPITFLLKESIGQNFSDHEVSIATLFIITFTTVLYTVYGGFKSVVITDSIQFIVYFGGGIYALFHLLYSLTDVSLQEIITRGQNSGKFILYHGFEGSFFKSPYFFLNGILGGTLISIGSHGVDQMFVQRLLACGNLKDSKKALIGSGIFVLFQFILFLSIGFLLFLFFNGQDIPQDKVFSKYITENIPSPVVGLLIAAILASAMSTLSSSINSMSLSFIIDFMKRDSDKEPSLLLSRIASIGWGFILFLSSMMPYFLSDRFTNGLVDLGLKITSFTFGPLIGLFLLAKLQKGMIYTSMELVFSLFGTILFTIGLTYLLSPALGLIIPMGLLLFYLFLGMTRIKQKVFQRTI
jgi:solute:Na+ symporter, SSS family